LYLITEKSLDISHAKTISAFSTVEGNTLTGDSFFK